VKSHHYCKKEKREIFHEAYAIFLLYGSVIMKKIGILIDSTNCSKYFYKTVSTLAGSKEVELFFLQNRYETSNKNIWVRIKSKVKTQGLLHTVESTFFHLLTLIEKKVFSLFSKNIKEHYTTGNINEFIKNKIVSIKPIVSTSHTTIHYLDKDIDKIKSFNLDIIIVDRIPGRLKGKILRSAKEGVLSFSYSDNRWKRGGPPAFWEVYLRKPSTGFTLQILTDEPEGGSIVFRGSIATRRSYTENIVDLYRESNPYLAKIVLQYVISNHLPATEEPFPYSGTLWNIPSVMQSILYVFKTVSLFSLLVLERLILKKDNRWGIAFINTSWEKAILSQGIQIKNPPNRFFADPFVITKNHRTICFVEDYCYRQKKAIIAAIEIVDQKQYKLLGPVIQEPFHMSFPYLFEYQNELYMIPETSEANAIRLYKCIEYPLKWEYQKDIMNGVKAVDSMIFEHEGRWWMLSTISTEGNEDDASQLFAYYSDHPLSDNWIAHKQNPIIFDNTIARNGGILDIGNSLPVRSRQKQGFNAYGTALTLARITELTPSTYKEEEIAQILPNFFTNIKRCHHMHSNGQYTVYDYLRTETFK